MLDSDRKTIVVCQGELAVSGDPNVMLSAVLGSCVATCLWDPNMRIGGMNHILLPGRGNPDSGERKYGAFAMEALINELMHNGAVKANLRAKVFGGARTFQNGLGIGDSNTEFVRAFLELEGIPIDAESTGGTQARRIRFYPENGRARQTLNDGQIASTSALPERAGTENKKVAAPVRGSGKVELF